MGTGIGFVVCKPLLGNSHLSSTGIFLIAFFDASG